MNRIPFTKMSGLGNDFIIIDNRNGIVPEIEIPLLAKKQRGRCRFWAGIAQFPSILPQIGP